MKLLQLALACFVPLFSFIVLLNPSGTIQSNLYPARLFMLLELVGLGGLWAIGAGSGSLLLSDYLRSVKPRFSWLGLLTLLYALWVVASAQLSPTPLVAWLGQPSSQFGALMLLCCLGATVLYANTAPVLWMIRAFTVVTALILTLTILEALGILPLGTWLHSQRVSYPAATVGHRPHLGGWYAVMALAPAFFYRQRPQDAWFWVWLVAALVGLGLSTTTAATLGVGVGLLGWLVFGARQRRWITPLAATFLFCLSVGGLPSLAQTASKALGQPPVEFKDYRSTRSFKPRLYLWKAAWAAAKERPLFGWGDETFSFQVLNHLTEKETASLFKAEFGLDQNYDIEKAFFGYRTVDRRGGEKKPFNIMYLKAHSIVFDEFYSHGIVGFLILTSLATTLLRRVAEKGWVVFILFVIALLPYVIYLLGWFYVVTVTPLFFILIGVMLADLKNSTPQEKEGNHDHASSLYSG